MPKTIYEYRNYVPIKINNCTEELFLDYKIKTRKDWPLISKMINMGVISGFKVLESAFGMEIVDRYQRKWLLDIRNIPKTEEEYFNFKPCAWNKNYL